MATVSPAPVTAPRRKLRLGGAASLSEAELLAIVLQRGRDATPALDLSDRLLARFGGLRRLLHAESRSLAAEKGIGDVRLCILAALPELARRYYEQTLPVGHAIRSPADTEAFLMARLRDLPHELFCCLYLDNRHRVLSFEELFRGTIDGTSVYPREVVKQALKVNAAAVILAHNHPSGIAEPSQADERITRRVKAALELLDIRLLDHLVIGDGTSTSLASRGLL
ncbi:MAG: DNA repair protein RadC [Gammaproteobacteria bacterium]|nr:DNA repair protein RadC [Gammaproteobacteria bacterium]MDH4315963.1 DNA repair protein RadC [Gammaproteobacteria bacterium]MDH5215389.1 DNA repair protein RadC [Gammaproteobacteria bacterium]MDH5501649.1 DNA repair protein RadC [Gammaproteobacteria bacterium]